MPCFRSFVAVLYTQFEVYFIESPKIDLPQVTPAINGSKGAATAIGSAIEDVSEHTFSSAVSDKAMRKLIARVSFSLLPTQVNFDCLLMPFWARSICFESYF